MTTETVDSHLPAETPELVETAEAAGAEDASTELLELSADEMEVVDESVPPLSGEAQVPAEVAAQVDEVSQSAADEAPESAAPADTVTPLRQSLLERIEQSTTLPRGLRGRLANALQEAPLVHEAGELLAPVGLLLDVVEQWSPAAMRPDPAALRRTEHPEGDAFFTGDLNDLSDEQAERIARRQLQRSGYLPRGKAG